LPAPTAPASPATKPSARVRLAGYSGELGTSMYFDRLAGRTLEVEALTAAGARHGIATPLKPRAARASSRHQRCDGKLGDRSIPSGSRGA
jgi:hypothetical protein